MDPQQTYKGVDYSLSQFGDYPFIRSSFQSHRRWIALQEINQANSGQEVLVRARVHNNRTKTSNSFIVLRENYATLQACAFVGEHISEEMIKFIGGIPCESIIDVVGRVKIPQKPIKSCSQQFEIEILKIFVVNRAVSRLPLQIIDASKKVVNNQFDLEEEDQEKKVEQVEKVVEKGQHDQQKQPKVEKCVKTCEKEKKKESQKPCERGQEPKQCPKEQCSQQCSKPCEKGEEPKQCPQQPQPCQKGEVKQPQAKKDHKRQKKQKRQQKEREAKEAKQKQAKQKEAKQVTVKMKTRLDNRVIDLRTPAKQAIFKLSSAVCQVFREFLLKQDFVQIHTPKLIGGSSEGGSNVFNFSYFNKKACLAQSPQLYKQMCVMGDFQKVFEIGPVFRAQNSFTHRHMCEFVGLDIEMSIKEHYFELLDFFGELFPYIFGRLQKDYARQLKAINEQFEFEPFKCKVPIVKLTFAEGIALLKENGIDWKHDEDLSTQVQRKLGQFVKAKYDTDFYMLHRYPATARPFYTMQCHDDPSLTCSYDFFMRGEEILSGAQRIHEPEMLTQRAIEKGIDPNTIKDYIECFKYGAYPHGGGGIGLERVVMLYCGLKNIRNASLFPRDPKRITP